MERMNEDGQWIVLMGFIVSVSLFVLAIIINQSVTVGQTTSEAVLEFPKNEITEVREAVIDIAKEDPSSETLRRDLYALSMDRMNAVVYYDITNDRYQDIYYKYDEILIRFNNGVTKYNETYWLPEKA
jgi:hypothetical protein